MRRRHRRLAGNPELDITAFMNLVIVLVPVLLLGMVFTQIRMIELDFPGMDAGETPEVESLNLVVTILPEGLEIADSERGVIRSLPNRDGSYDIAGLRETLKAVKSRLPDKTDAVLEVSGDVDYQTLVTAMDAVRSYATVSGLSRELSYLRNRRGEAPETGFEITVMAGRETPYRLLRKVMKTCIEQDYRRVRLAVEARQEEVGNG